MPVVRPGGLDRGERRLVDRPGPLPAAGGGADGRVAVGLGRVARHAGSFIRRCARIRPAITISGVTKNQKHPMDSSRNPSRAIRLNAT